MIINQNVSRKTFARFRQYADMLSTWNSTHNLVGASTLQHIFSRHIEDSLQLQSFLPADPGEILDLGSGAGLPGLILACMETNQQHRFHLVEKNAKRAAFLRYCSAELNLTNVTILQNKFEEIQAFPIHQLTCRAFAPLSRLLPLSDPWINQSPDLTLTLLKGRTVESELESVEGSYKFDARIFDSIGSDGKILQLTGLKKK